MCFNFCFFRFSWGSCRYYKFCCNNNICATTAGIKKYELLIKKKKKKKHGKIVLLAKTILNNIEVLISQALIFSNISHDKCVKRIR